MAGVVSPEDVTVSHARPALLEQLAKNRKEITIVTDNVKAVKDADLVIVAVKPWLMEQVLGEIAASLDRQRQVVISIAAGLTFEMLAGYLSCSTLGPVGLYRVIPNTAISLGQSVTSIARQGTTSAQDQAVLQLFGALGAVFEVTEEQMVAVTSLSSCGIAYALKYIDASMRGGEQMGIPREESLRIVRQTIQGALALLEANGTMPQTEIDKVTTPGGITLKGLEAMERGGFSQAVLEGLLASK